MPLPPKDAVVTPAASADATSPTLLDLAQAADPAGWDRLVRLYSPLVFSWARRSGLASEDAADVTQDVWQAVAGAMARFDRSRGGFRAWLYTITRNKVRDHFRRRHNRPLAEGGSAAQSRLAELPELEPEDETSAGDTTDLLRRVLDLIRRDFEPRTWQAFWSTAVDGRSAAEVAAALTTTTDAIYQAKARVLKRLRETLGEMN